MDIREEVIQVMYELMCSEKGVHDEVDQVHELAETITCNGISETSTDYYEIMNALCELEKTCFFAGASMVLDFISGREV